MRKLLLILFLIKILSLSQVTVKPEEINKFITKKQELVKQKTLRQTYSKNSFFILTLNSKIRKLAITMIEANSFQYLVRLFIMLNVGAFMVRYFHTDAEVSHDLEKPAFYFELVCNFYFLLEISVRILAMGLVFEKKTFLRDPFQFMDFVVTAARFLTVLHYY